MQGQDDLERGELGEALSSRRRPDGAPDSGSPDIDHRGRRQDAMRAVDDATEVPMNPRWSLPVQIEIGRTARKPKGSCGGHGPVHERMADHPNEKSGRRILEAAEAYYNLDDRGKAIELLGGSGQSENRGNLARGGKCERILPGHRECPGENGRSP